MEISSLKKFLKAEFMKFQHDMDEHLQAINENTNEISSNYEYICELENKIDKLNERVDHLQICLRSDDPISVEKINNFNVKKLNRAEQQVFLVIYTLEEEKGFVTYEDISKKLKVSEQLAGSYVTSLIEKGVPIIKRYINSKPYLMLDKEFKTLQAKENILQLSLEEFGF